MKNIKRYKLYIEKLFNINKTVLNKETGETALTASHTLTQHQPADNWQISGEVVNHLASTHCICLFICSSCLYLSTYMHKLSLKLTVSTCVRNS